jgi:hypothetical protein
VLSKTLNLTLISYGVEKVWPFALLCPSYCPIHRPFVNAKRDKEITSYFGIFDSRQVHLLHRVCLIVIVICGSSVSHVTGKFMVAFIEQW